MLSIALYLLTHAMLLSLHLSGGSFPRPLSAQEEKKYVERMLAGDIEARNVLVEHNLRLVAHIAKKYYTQSDEQDDLISIGTIGLIKGVSSYRPEKGTRLATYAAKCVENEILMYFRSRKKLQGEVSLNDSLDSDADGESLYLKLNRAVLYSATVLRKAIEDEIEAEKVAKEQNWTLPECKIMSGVISATKYPYTDEDGWAFRGKICVSSYGEGQAASLKVKDVCNWLLHSYVWGVAGYADQKGFAGFLVASDFDKEKFVHFVSFDEWQKVIDAAIKNGAF